MLSWFVDRRIRYFRYAGEANTDFVLEVVKYRVLEGGIGKVIIASETGRSAVKAVNMLGELGVKIVVVTHYPAYTNSSKGRIPIGLTRSEYREKYEYLIRQGCIVVQGTRPFAPPSRMIRWDYPTPEAIIEKTLEVISPGLKISIEAILIATDSGTVGEGEDVISCAGTFKGLDTAIVATTTYTMNFYSKFKVKEILAIPTCRITKYPEDGDPCWKGDLDAYLIK